jgi:hypothetical protein
MAKSAQSSAKRRIFSRQVDQVPRIKRDLGFLDLGDGAKTVPFRLEDPIRIVSLIAIKDNPSQ